MLFLSIVHHYFLWHYTRALLEIFHVWFNFIWFVVHFFSLPQLMQSWLAPWKRMTEGRGNKWNFEDLAAYIIINFFSRIIGALLRTTVIAVGLIALFLTIIGGVLVYVVWLAAPLFIVILLAGGVSLLFI